MWDDAARDSVPVWPLGLPSWDSSWLAVGRAGEDETVLAVWWRGGAEREVCLPIPHGTVETVFPATTTTSGLETIPDGDRLRLRATSDEPAARLLRIRHQGVR